MLGNFAYNVLFVLKTPDKKAGIPSVCQIVWIHIRPDIRPDGEEIHIRPDGEERAGCFALFVFLVSHDYCVALPNDATGLSAVCDCGIS